MSTRKRIFEQIKKEMLNNIERATLESLDEVFQLNQQLFIYANNLNEIPNYLEPEENNTKIGNVIVTEEFQKKEPKVKETNTGIFNQNIIHGYIESQNDGKIFIPESRIRENNFHQGDLVKFTPYGQSKDNKTLYNYKLIKKSKPIDTSRRTFIKGIVEIDPYDNQLIVKKNVEGRELKGAQKTFTSYVIPKNTVERFNIVEGSNVDIAWDKDDIINSIRVTWRH